MGGYSLSQVELLLDAIDQAEKSAARTALIVARGAQANKDGFKKLLKEFD